MSCIDEDTIDLIFKTLGEKYEKTSKDAKSPYESEIRKNFTKEDLRSIEQQLFLSLTINDQTAITNTGEPVSFFDYENIVKTVGVLMPEPPIGGEGDELTVKHESPIYFRFSSTKVVYDILAIVSLLLSICVIYIGVSKIQKFNETILEGEFNIKLSLTDIVYFKSVWQYLKGHNFCEVIVNNLIYKTKTLIYLTGRDVIDNCYTFKPTDSTASLLLTSIESWYDRDRITTCTMNYGKLAFDRMKLDLINKAENVPSGFKLIWCGIAVGQPSILYFAERFGVKKMIESAMKTVNENAVILENENPSRIAGGKKSKRRRKGNKRTKKNRRRSNRRKITSTNNR